MFYALINLHQAFAFNNCNFQETLFGIKQRN